MKTQITQRLFYKKFPYKARLAPQWANTARSLTTEQIVEYSGRTKAYDRDGRLVLAHPKEITDLHNFFLKYSKDELKFRQEGELSIFFKDIKVFNELTGLFPKIVKTLWKPVNDQALGHMVDNVRVEVKPKLTHNCRYKVVLKGKLANISNENRTAFIRLYKRHPTEFVLPKSTQKDFEYPHKFFWGTPYFYVKDSKYLLMAQMMIQPLIKETVQIVTHDEIAEKENVDVIENS